MAVTYCLCQSQTFPSHWAIVWTRQPAKRCAAMAKIATAALAVAWATMGAAKVPVRSYRRAKRNPIKNTAKS